MNISGILQGFSAYLESLNESSDKAYNTDNSSISVFMYSSKFKSYITEELNIADPTIFSKSINEILGMQWLNRLIGLGLQQTGLDITSRIGGSLRFFLYDTVKIVVLLTVLIFIISYIQSYFPL